MVISQSFGGRPLQKFFWECMKLHLYEYFLLVKLLTKGFFKVVLFKKEGTRTTWKICRNKLMSFSFLKYQLHFNVTIKESKCQLTHIIKV